MSHDELLAICDNYSFKDSAEPVKALRAVVELHRPEHIIVKGFKTEYWCMADNNEPTPYPCPTILQIEKEIK